MTAESSVADVPIATLVKQQGDALYVFAVAMRNHAVKGAFTVKGLAGKTVAEVLGESRQIDVADGRFSDDFAGYGVHLYRIAPAK